MTNIIELTINISINLGNDFDGFANKSKLLDEIEHWAIDMWTLFFHATPVTFRTVEPLTTVDKSQE